MADPTQAPEEAPHFDTSDVEANRAIEQGLGVGARELEAQRDAGGIVTPDVYDGEADDGVERNTAVLGSDDEDARASDV